MPRLLIAMLGAAMIFQPARGQSPPFIVDDDEFVAKVTQGAARLRAASKLVPIETLRRQVQMKTCRVPLAAPSVQKFDPPQLYERLRESVLAIGTVYRCPDCKEWHFTSSAGFVVAESGIVCTCCHVVTTEDPGIKEGYLVAANAAGQVYPVRAVQAADVDSDTCFLKLDAPRLKPLSFRRGVRTGERVYCLSHPGGYHFMFTQGMVSRLNRRRNEVVDGKGHATGGLTRPILLLNVTAEFAPGSSGAPIVDEAGNVVGQVASIADAGEPDNSDETVAPSPSVPVRFCTATEEILRLAEPKAEKLPSSRKHGSRSND